MEELTRDVRTVFVGQLQVRVKEKDIKRFFKKVGGVKVNDIEVRMLDRLVRTCVCVTFDEAPGQ